MKKKVIIALIALVALIALAVTFDVRASDVSDAEYSGVIQITNNGTATTAISVNCSIDTQSLIDLNHILSSCNNTSIITNAGADTAYMPSVNSSYPWCIWVPSIGDSTYLSYILYTGGSTDMDGKLCYFPGSTGMTTADSASLELGDNFTIEQDLYIDTTAVGSNITIKVDAFRTYISGSGNITAEFSEYDVSPDSHTDGSGTWHDETNAYDEDTGTFALDNAAAHNYLELIPPSSIISSNIRIWCARYYSGTFDPDVTIDVYYSGGWNNIQNGVITHGEWVTLPIGSQEAVTNVRAKMNGYTTSVFRIYELDIMRDAFSVTATGISSGEYKLEVYADSSNLTMEINDAIQDITALSGVSIPDNSNDWNFCESTAVPYLEYQEITVDGVQRQYIEWENATTFTDQSGNGNDATPTFRTTSSDADVSASLISFTPISQAVATDWSLTVDNLMIGDSDLPAVPSSAYREIETTNLFFAPVFDLLVQNSGQLRATFWYPIAILIVCSIGIILFWASKSVFAQYIIMGVVMFILSFTLLPWWTAIVFVIYGLGISLASKQFGGV